ncbi:MAG: ABC transporter ATP-binding protein [Clostridia bacterium]|nr:ABC transporter ATP-binding protein [Clostridia bacterium]
MAETEKKKRQKPGRVLANTLYLLGMAWKISPRFFFGYIFDALVLSAWSILDAWYFKRVFDLLDMGAPVSEILWMLLAVALTTTLLLLSNTVYWWTENEKQKLVIKCGLQLKLFDHALSLDIGKYEIPEFYNDFIWAVRTADVKVCEILKVVRNLIRRVSSGAAVFGILVSLDLFTAAFILVLTASGAVCSTYINKKCYAYDMESRRSERVASYVSRVHYLADYAKELRISEAGKVLEKLYDESTEERRGLIRKYFGKVQTCGAFWNVIGAVKDNGLILILLYKMMVEKTVLLGGFALGVTSSWRVSSALQEIITAATELAKHSLYIEKLRTFFDTKTSIEGGTKMPERFESLECKNISFAYENGVEVLHDVSLKITAGEKIAIVGYNGAGKTTLIKLLMRFYDVTGGEILLNGINIKEYDLDAYRKVIGAVFQDYKIFAATVAENVACGLCSDDAREGVTAALDAASFTDKLQKLPDGLDTHLTREFSDKGTNLSGGESQKIAIARALYKRAPVTVMDEPSSALDPVAEYELNRHIENALTDQTVIFISHRLSTTRGAARIYMFEHGRIIEDGSHDALIAQNGKYAAMFNLQASKYRT